MRLKHRQQNTQKSGFATIELLIAFAILVINITGVLLLTSGTQGSGTGQVIYQGQAVAINSETNQEAIYKAQQQIEDKKVLAKNDFFSVVTTAPINELSGPLSYTKNFTVADLTPCKKQATSSVSWNTTSLHPQNVEFSTLLTDIAGALALGGDCPINPPGDWDNPVTATSISIGGQGATDIDVHKNFVYLSSDASAPAKEDLFIYEFNPTTITLTQKSALNVDKGLTKIETIDNYAFALDSEDVNQFRVFNVSDPENPTLVISKTLPNITSGTSAIGRSIFYYDKDVYIGTQYLPCPSCSPEKNNEFHIYGVATPSSPVWKGSFNVNHNINDIVVRGDYAYLATSGDDSEVVILNISNPSNITLVGVFDAEDMPSGAGEDGTAVYLIGNKLYLGRESTPSTRPDFYIIDITTPSTPTELGSKYLALSSSAYVTGIVVRNNLAFVGVDNPTSGLSILNISNPLSITDHPVCTTLNFSENSTALDMDNDFIFSSNESNHEIRVIRDQASICS